MRYLIWFILIAVAWFFIKRFLNRFKITKIGSVALFSGGVKTGKSTIGVSTGLGEYKRSLRAWKFRKFFCKIFRRQIPEKPLLYSNIPLGVDYVPLTKDLIFRKKRFAFGSVIIVDEASLLADSQLIKDTELNERLLLWVKLIGQETHSGKVIFISHTISDLHYSIKRGLSNYFYVHHVVTWIPFVIIAYVREFNYSDDDTSVINTITSDAEDSLKKVIIWKRVWKKFDYCAWSSLTDDLPVETTTIKGKQLLDLKIHSFASFREYRTLPKDFIYNLNDDVKFKEFVNNAKKDA